MTLIRGLALVTAAAAVGGGIFLYSAFGAFLPWRERGEAARAADLAGIQPGTVVAEIGAGKGLFSVEFARRVGPSGRVYATEITPEAVAGLAARAEAEGMRNIVETRGERTKTNLPGGCCDVLFLRNVYHHVTEPASFGRELRKALQDDGRLVVVDFEAGALWFHGGRPGDSPERRPGHGVARTAAIAELRTAGFEVERQVPDWNGPMWLVVFRAVPITGSSEAARRRP